MNLVVIDGRRLRAIRQASGWSTDDLQKRTSNLQPSQGGEVSLREIQEIERRNRKSVRPRILLALAHALRVRPGELEPARLAGTTRRIDRIEPGLAAANETLESLGTAPPLPGLVVGRDQDIAEIKKRLLRDSKSVQVLIAIRGLPGVGKTTLASQVAHDLSPQFHHILYTAIGQLQRTRARSEILSRLRAWCTAIGKGPRHLPQTVEEARGILTAALRDLRCLLIIDDVWMPEHATPFLVGGRASASVITTRDNAVARDVAPTAPDIHHLRCLDFAQSLELLSLLARPVVQRYRSNMEALAHRLEGLPLALQVAGRTLQAEYDRHGDIPRLLADVEDLTNLLKSTAPVEFRNVLNESSPTIAALLAKSTDWIGATARRRFAMLGVFPADPATFSLTVASGFWKISEKEARDSLGELVDRGLLSATGSGRYQLHSVLAAHARSLWHKGGYRRPAE